MRKIPYYIIKIFVSMNILKKLKQWFAKKDKPCEERSESGMQNTSTVSTKDEKTCGDKMTGIVQMLLEMPHNIVHPADLMESLLMAISYQTRGAVCCSVKDIELYNMFDQDDSFLGSFYALNHEGVFYGNIVGSPQVFSCAPDAFRFEKTNLLYAPLRNEDGKHIVLMCRYNRKNASLEAVCLKKMDEFMQNEEILHEFVKGTSFNEAYSFWEKVFSQK